MYPLDVDDGETCKQKGRRGTAALPLENLENAVYLCIGHKTRAALNQMLNKGDVEH